MSEQLQFDPATMDPRAVYHLLIGSVVPRPIGWASTVSAEGVANLAPFSFFTVVCVKPPMISLTIMRKPDDSEKHTLKNARATGELKRTAEAAATKAPEQRRPGLSLPGEE